MSNYWFLHQPKSRLFFFAALSVILAGALWGTTGTIQALLLGEKDSFAVAFLRVSIGTAALVLLSFFTQRKLKRSNQPSAQSGSLFNPLILISGASLASYNVFFFLGVANAGVSVGTAIALGSGPIWVTVFETMSCKKLPGVFNMTGMICAIIGLCVLVGVGTESDLHSQGLLSSCIAGISYAIYAMTSHQLSKTVDPIQNCLRTFSVSTILLSPILFVSSFAWITLGDILPLIFLGVCATAVAFILFSYGVSLITPSRAVVLALIEPITAWLLAINILGEVWTRAQLIGASVLLVGMYMVGKSMIESETVKNV